MQNEKFKYTFSLFIDGRFPESIQYAEELKEFLSKQLIDTYTLHIFDLVKDIEIFEKNRVIAVPALHIITPQKERHKFVGKSQALADYITAIGMQLKVTGMARRYDRMMKNHMQMEKEREEMTREIYEIRQNITPDK